MLNHNKGTKPKIAIIVDQLTTGGVQQVAFNEASNFKKIGINVTLFVLVRSDKRKYPNLPKDLEVIFLSDLNPKPFQKALHIPPFTFLTTLHILSPVFVKNYEIFESFDFIISHGTTTSITASAISKKYNLPYLAFIWDPMVFIFEKIYQRKIILHFLKPLIKIFIFRIEKSFLSQAFAVVTASRLHQRFLEKTYGIKSSIIYPGYNVLKKPTRKVPEFFLGYTRWEFAKNPTVFLELALKLRKARFLIAGSWNNPAEKTKFKAEIGKLKLSKQIQVLNSIEESELPKLVSGAIAWIHPHFEAFGLAGLEMASLGVLPIIPAGSGLTELFEDGKQGFFPKTASPRNILPILAKLIKNPQLAIKMGKAAQKVAKNYTWEKHTIEVFKLINPMLMTQKRVEIAVIEAGHTTEKFLAGGDVLLEKLLGYFPKNYKFAIISSKFGIKHWRKSGLPITEFVFAKNWFENSSNPVKVLILYLIRSYQGFIDLTKTNSQIIISTTDLFCDVAPAFLFKKPEVKWIAWVHHLLPTPTKRAGNLFVNIFSYFLQQTSLILIKFKADLIICRNLDIFKNLKKSGFDVKKLRVIDTGVDFERVYKHKVSQNYDFDGLFLGRLHFLKGVFDLPAIWSYVAAELPLAKLAIIGSGTIKNIKFLKQQIKEKKVEKNIQVLGPLPDNKMLDILKTAKVFLFTDLEAGFSLSTAEAMAAGIPVIAYNLPIFGSIYQKGFIKVPEGDVKQAAVQIIRLLRDGKLRQTLGQQGIDQARLLDRKKTAQDFWKLVGKL